MMVLFSWVNYAMQDQSATEFCMGGLCNGINLNLMDYRLQFKDCGGSLVRRSRFVERRSFLLKNHTSLGYYLWVATLLHFVM